MSYDVSDRSTIPACSALIPQRGRTTWMTISQLPAFHRIPLARFPTTLPMTPLQSADLITQTPTSRLDDLSKSFHFNQSEHPSGRLVTLSLQTLDAIVHPKEVNNRIVRLCGIFFVVASLLYLPWLFLTLNKHVLWFSLPFVGANLYANGLVLLTLFNSWHRSSPYLYQLPQGAEVPIAVLLPTCGEPAEMLSATIESVLTQQWPHDKLLLLIGDDSHRDEVRLMVEDFQRRYPATDILYHLPPLRNSPQRQGDAKAGNLNSLLAFIAEHFPHIKYVETRDADDLVGDPNFLRYTVGHLIANPKTAYVQTIKEARVSPGDPFGNMQTFFYRGQMLAKHATNAVFPCGSGLVWRREALVQIGGFPGWNVVEDLYSGYVAMQHGLKSTYLPIVGAFGQTAPEDIPNVYKQIGTWALDSFRLFVWKNPWKMKGLTFRQRMQFMETTLFYSISLPLLILVLTPLCSLAFGIQPIVSTNLDYALHAWTYIISVEILLLALGKNIPLQNLWRCREMCLGMLFVFLKACFLAVTYGPNKKPVYKVTRKEQQVGFYLRETFPQIFVCIALLVVSCYHLLTHQWRSDFGSLFWALFYVVIFSSFIRKSWFGVFKKISRKAERGDE